MLLAIPFSNMQVVVLLVNTESPLLMEMMLVWCVQLTVSSLQQTVLCVSVSKITTDISWKMFPYPAQVCVACSHR